MGVGRELLPSLVVLRAAYPHGLPDTDYLPLLAALDDGYSDRQLAALIAEFTGRERVMVDNDHAKVMSTHRPAPEQVAAARTRLTEAGYDALDD